MTKTWKLNISESCPCTTDIFRYIAMVCDTCRVCDKSCDRPHISRDISLAICPISCDFVWRSRIYIRTTAPHHIRTYLLGTQRSVPAPYTIQYVRMTHKIPFSTRLHLMQMCCMWCNADGSTLRWRTTILWTASTRSTRYTMFSFQCFLPGVHKATPPIQGQKDIIVLFMTATARDKE